MIKKIVLYVSLLYAVYFFAIILTSFICESSWCRIRDDDFFGIVFFVFLPFLLVFLFSIITYRMRDEIFRAWWNFAVWFVPIIVIVTFLQNIEHQQSGFAGVAQGSFETLILIIFYTIFIIVSLARIIAAARGIKNNPNN